ncbi:MAG: hypothetical protein AB4042_20705 [Leptolyngbyaceae cyanobacterium]
MLFNQSSGYRLSHVSQTVCRLALIGLLSVSITGGVCGVVEPAYASASEEGESGSGIPGNRAGGGTRLSDSPTWSY